MQGEKVYMLIYKENKTLKTAIISTTSNLGIKNQTIEE